jgi:hypothetical protein
LIKQRLRGVLCSQERGDRLAIKVCCGIAGSRKFKAVLVAVHQVGEYLSTALLALTPSSIKHPHIDSGNAHAPPVGSDGLN